MDTISAALPTTSTRIAADQLSPEEGLRLLLDAWERPLFRFLMTVVHDEDEANDCAQDAFLRAYQALVEGREVSGAWLFTVARHRAIDRFRRNRRTRCDLEALERIPVAGPSDCKMGVEETMALLPPLDREVLWLFAVGGFKTDEIGAMLGVRGTAIRQRLYRAREKFRLLYRDSE